MNTAGHKKGGIYEIQLNDKNGDGVIVNPLPEQQFNGTLMNGANVGSLMVLLEEDYNGQLLQVQFEYPDAPLGPFEPAQAWRSTIQTP